MSETTKLCRDCRHFLRIEGEHLCGKHARRVMDDPVLGEERWVRVRDARVERNAPSFWTTRCGPTGRFWEPRG